MAEPKHLNMLKEGAPHVAGAALINDNLRICRTAASNAADSTFRDDGTSQTKFEIAQ
jgi:hypothetical protein